MTEKETPQQARDRRIQLITSRISELTTPTPVVSMVKRYDAETGTHRPALHKLEGVSLLAEVEMTVSATIAGSASGGYRSKPVVNVEAIRVQQDIEREVEFWFTNLLEVTPPPTVVERLKYLSKITVDLDDRQVRNLCGDVRRWWGWARDVIGYDTPAKTPHVQCMNCGKWDTLRVRFSSEGDSATCIECREVWSDSRWNMFELHYRNAAEFDGVQFNKPIVIESGDSER